VRSQLNARVVSQQPNIMRREIKEDAEVLRQGLALGVLPISRAITWADRIIADSARGDVQAPIYEVALGATRPISELIEQLGAVRGSVDAVVVSRRLLGVLAQWYGEDAGRGAHVAQAIYDLARAGVLPEAEFGTEPFFLDEYFSEPHFFEAGAGDVELAAYLRQQALAAGL
jgi:hypothetical protein